MIPGIIIETLTITNINSNRNLRFSSKLQLLFSRSHSVKRAMIINICGLAQD